MKEFQQKTELFGHSIEARCTILDDGLHVLLTGGSRTHVGALSYAFPGEHEKIQTIQFPEHRDGAVSERWAGRLCQRFRMPVVVNCGIHYDHVNRADIERILAAAEDLLEQVEALLQF